ncbi:sulfatase [Gimesia aquarii]|uniref:Arylsulfatase n=1 Tax=Gimesia aquarii TaxID=2527964 RepID=A0A517WQC1_9PLAN|nr:sulfatase [Gimesia aquarii]QDU07451.1 Arylsulfatase [Gimesia aquarii]
MKQFALILYKTKFHPFLLFPLFVICTLSTEARAAAKPNVIVIYADDLGYGDLACFGHPTIKTPHLDQMAAEGMKFTQFYSAAPVCTPSRAALLTGRYPIRSGMCSDKRRVLFPDSGGGLQASEVTLAEALKETGYKTACVGKWHLGHLPQFLPTSHGFDSYFGIPYSNDMDRVAERKLRRKIFLKPKVEYWNVPLMRNQEVIERPADQTTITKRYTKEAIKFIKGNQKQPFYLYLAHSMPHVPLFRSKALEDTSRRGLYGDVIEEIDWSVGQILQTLKDQGLDQNTIVWFSSDNGPWLIFNEQGGSAGLLREGKGSTWEGGMREPTLAWWPGHISSGSVTHELGSTMDIFTTSIQLAGGKVPSDRVVDGVDLSSVLLGTGESPRKEMAFYRGTKLMAFRKGPWKAHFITKPAYGREPFKEHHPPVLYHLEHDPSEKYDVAKANPEVIKSIKAAAEKHQQSIKPVPSQLEIPLKK